MNGTIIPHRREAVTGGSSVFHERVKIAAMFPPQPWVTIDPIIMDGAERLWPELASSRLYGGGESWCNTDAADEACETCDFLVKVGTPAWWNLNDRHLYARWLETGKPFGFFGIGVAGGTVQWEGFQEDLALMKRLFESDSLVRCAVRDERAWRLCAGHASDPMKVVLLPCPGFFAGSSPRIVTKKERVCVDVLDPNTLAKDGLYSPESYYSQVADLVLSLEKRGAEVVLSCQRPFGSAWEGVVREARRKFPFRKTQLVDPASWLDAGGKSVVDWIEPVLGRERSESLVGFPTKESFSGFFSGVDCYIGSRTHGVLPAAGSGVPSFGMRIDLRGEAWNAVKWVSTGSFIPPLIPVEEALLWWDTLEPEPVSRALVASRELYAVRYTDVVFQMMKAV